MSQEAAMSNPSEHPEADPAGPDPGRAADAGPAGQGPDPDAWATACEEDLAAERARRRERYGPPPGDAADELRKLADAVTERLGHLGAALGGALGPAAGLAAGPLAERARAAVEPVIERNADVIQHLAGAGQELLAAYRSAVMKQEQRWARPSDAAADGPRARSGAAADEAGARSGGAAGPERPGGQDGTGPGEKAAERDDPDGPAGSGGSQRIDLD
ncbi:DUF5304 family protein [Streptomyces marincola]|uniref:DUF5304 domain-containing protein n=1 Tax=Streptomyces marincola TaxID=2878388 RepID=A0A1W7D2I8_9ACTN|nr:DUF5304 family protein [Streptomyces marincola]ARQ71222.1 hypothetical protein CAG99_22485 [Streptomyces marincola]